MRPGKMGARTGEEGAMRGKPAIGLAALVLMGLWLGCNAILGNEPGVLVNDLGTGGGSSSSSTGSATGNGGAGGMGGAATGSGGADAGALPVCGDGQKDGVEECDDGNNLPGDRCGASCAVEDPTLCPGTPIALDFLTVAIADDT